MPVQINEKECLDSFEKEYLELCDYCLVQYVVGFLSALYVSCRSTQL